MSQQDVHINSVIYTACGKVSKRTLVGKHVVLLIHEVVRNGILVHDAAKEGINVGCKTSLSSIITVIMI